MSMHEINSAAEAITAAADPEANIIFGATINPEIQGEIIITVVATGFDDAYYANRPKTHVVAGNPKKVDKEVTTAISGIDMDLPDNEVESDFHSDTPMPNIWTLDHHDEKDAKSEEVAEEPAESSKDETEDELEKPSFLRRLKNRNKSKDERKDKKDK
jgi:cell division protein FtsZ